MSKVAVIGLGYVGLPLAVAFSHRGHKVVGIDIQAKKLAMIRKGDDPSGEVDKKTLKNSPLELTDDFSRVADCQFIIVAVPTPVNSMKLPDLEPMVSATASIAPHVRNRAIIVYESTVYPGVTEEICEPVLIKAGKKRSVDYRLGYSPERINPGDKEHTIHKVVKVVSGQDEETLDEVAKLYESVVDAGVHRAESIKVAEAAKVIENTQRDLNIALMNELSIIFDRLGIRTNDVLRAAQTKWNFLRFQPGLVGGHCIGVDPYYLTFRAQAAGYIPQVITAGRRINDGMGKHVAEKTVKLLIKNGEQVKGAHVLILGLTFKENVPDFRNSRVVDIIEELREYQVDVSAHDPFAAPGEKLEEFGLASAELDKVPPVDALILAVSHDAYRAFNLERLRKFFVLRKPPILVDVKGLYEGLKPEKEGFVYWQL